MLKMLNKKGSTSKLERCSSEVSVAKISPVFNYANFQALLKFYEEHYTPEPEPKKEAPDGDDSNDNLDWVNPEFSGSPGEE